MSSLKDALLKAGLKPSKMENERPKFSKNSADAQGQNQTPAKSQGSTQDRPYIPPKAKAQDRPYVPPQAKVKDRPYVPPTTHIKIQEPVKKIHSHQATRNFCEVCDRTQPDVEYFKHRNPTVQANWICISCADKNEIPDSTRTTAQSDMSKKKMFRRSFGATNHAIRPDSNEGSGR